MGEKILLVGVGVVAGIVIGVEIESRVMGIDSVDFYNIAYNTAKEKINESVNGVINTFERITAPLPENQKQNV